MITGASGVPVFYPPAYQGASLMPVLDLISLDPNKLSYLASLRGWVRKDIAQAAGLSYVPVAHIFRGKGISPRTAKRIADALGVTIADLIPETPETQRRTK